MSACALLPQKNMSWMLSKAARQNYQFGTVCIQIWWVESDFFSLLPTDCCNFQAVYASAYKGSATILYWNTTPHICPEVNINYSAFCWGLLGAPLNLENHTDFPGHAHNVKESSHFYLAVFWWGRIKAIKLQCSFIRHMLSNRKYGRNKLAKQKLFASKTTYPGFICLFLFIVYYVFIFFYYLIVY